ACHARATYMGGYQAPRPRGRCLRETEAGRGARGARGGAGAAAGGAPVRAGGRGGLRLQGAAVAADPGPTPCRLRVHPDLRQHSGLGGSVQAQGAQRGQELPKGR
ncbi:unnamed protein product, partial [Effrenium voratum]